MITKEEFGKLLDRQDQMITILKRLDEERVFTFEWIKRIEAKVKEQEEELKKQKEDIQKLKLELKVV
jgi:hypothetical protein